MVKLPKEQLEAIKTIANYDCSHIHNCSDCRYCRPNGLGCLSSMMCDLQTNLLLEKAKEIDLWNLE